MSYREHGHNRLAQAVENQRSAGEGCFSLPYDEIDEIVAEQKEELVGYQSAYSELRTLKEDLGTTDNEPGHYQGDGLVTCSRALRSMFDGWERAGFRVSGLAKYWAGVAFKYIWRFPLKDDPRRDLEKAADCVSRAMGCESRYDDGDYDEPGYVWVVDGKTGKDAESGYSDCPLAVFAHMEEADDYFRELVDGGGEGIIVKLPVGEVVE